MPESPLSALLRGPQQHLSGTDLRVVLPVSRNLINELLNARPAGTPVQELMLDPEEGNLAHLHLQVRAPVVGTVRRKLTLRPGGPVSFPDHPWLHVDITDGFRLLDKPIIKLMRGQIAERLPKSIELTADHLRLHIPALLTAAGYQSLVPLIKRFQLAAKDNQLVLTLHLQAE